MPNVTINMVAADIVALGVVSVNIDGIAHWPVAGGGFLVPHPVPPGMHNVNVTYGGGATAQIVNFPAVPNPTTITVTPDPVFVVQIAVP